MRSLFAGIVLMSTLAVGAAHAAVPADAVLAVKAADAWLATVDSGQYGTSWKQASPLFQAAMSEQAWDQALQGVRTPLGKLLSRSVVDTQYTTEMPGAPDGQYWAILEQASFEHKAQASEAVILMKVGNDWKVAGYHIR